MAKLTANVDGGARGNPGPAAIGVVLRGPDGEVLEEVGERIGRATNNVAEYRALLRGIELADSDSCIVRPATDADGVGGNGRSSCNGNEGNSIGIAR